VDNGEHEVLVLEIGQNLFIVNQARTVVAMENGHKHLVLVLEIG
jgi:hypothetical protein